MKLFNFNRSKQPISDRQFNRFVLNTAKTLREELSPTIGKSHDDLRDTWDIYGYPTVRGYAQFYQYYQFDGIANRAITSYPVSCWRDGATLEVNGKEVATEDIDRMTNIGMFRQLEKADILNRIGRFSALYVGIPGQEPKAELSATGKVDISQVYFTPYCETAIEVLKTEEDKNSARYGQPVSYNLATSDTAANKREVHWSRLVIMAEGSLTDPNVGIPYLDPILNDIINLGKTSGGAAEAYFSNAKNKIMLNIDPAFYQLLTPDQKVELDTELKKFTNEGQKFLRLGGTTASALNTPHADPTGTMTASRQNIYGYTKITKRMWTGEGGGQYAGSEDKESYNQVNADRQNTECAPWLMRTLNILATATVIAPIPDNAKIVWPIKEALSAKEKAEIASLMAGAAASISAATGDFGGLTGELSPEQAITEILGLEYDPIPDDRFDDLPEEVTE